MKKIELIVLHYELLHGDDTFALVAWRSSKGLSFLDRILLLGTVASWEKRYGTLPKNHIYRVQFARGRGLSIPFKKVKYQIQAEV